MSTILHVLAQQLWNVAVLLMGLISLIDEIWFMLTAMFA